MDEAPQFSPESGSRPSPQEASSNLYERLTSLLSKAIANGPSEGSLSGAAAWPVQGCDRLETVEFREDEGVARVAVKAGRRSIGRSAPGQGEDLDRLLGSAGALERVATAIERLRGAGLRWSGIEALLAAYGIKVDLGQVEAAAPPSPAADVTGSTASSDHGRNDTAPRARQYRIFVSYSQIDETYRLELERSLAPLRRERLIETWSDRSIEAGASWAAKIKQALERANVVVLLVSSDFIASDYCWTVEMEGAIRRHHEGLARVIPIIIRPCVWQSLPFGSLEVLPRKGRPVSKWEDRDEAWTDVVAAIRRMADRRS